MSKQNPRMLVLNKILASVTLGTSRDWEVSRYVTDLGILAVLPRQNDENFMLCAGFGYNAQIKIAEMTCHKES